MLLEDAAAPRSSVAGSMLNSPASVVSGLQIEMPDGSPIAIPSTGGRPRRAPGLAIKASTAPSSQTGFSAFELVGIVAIILIIAAIALPNVIVRSHMIANEAAAVGSLRTINTECVTYSGLYHIGFPSTLARLGPAGSVSSTSAQLIDSVLAGGENNGYAFTYVPGAPVSGVISTYTLSASPITPGQTGQRFFYTDQSGVIRSNLSATATVSDAPVQ